MAVDIVLAPADVYPHITTIGPAQILQTLLERRKPGLTFWIVLGSVQQHGDAPHSLGLLRQCLERPRRR
jgi:hypothetical protein